MLVPILGACHHAPIGVRQHSGRATTEPVHKSSRVRNRTGAELGGEDVYGSRQRAFVAARKNSTAVSPTSTPQSTAAADQEGAS